MRHRKPIDNTADAITQDPLDGVLYYSVEGLIALNRWSQLFNIRQSRSAKRAGEHSSQRKGRGMDYLESRQYQAGDDIRHIDWRLTARTQDTYSKHYSEEQQKPVMVWCDVRDHMAFATQGVFKSAQVSRIAALLTWNTWHRNDKIGMALLDSKQHHELRPTTTRNGMLSGLRMTANASQMAYQNLTKPPQSSTHSTLDLNDSFKQLRRIVETGSRVYIISDFHDLKASHQEELWQIKRRADLVFIQVLDAIDIDLPKQNKLRIIDTSKPEQQTVELHRSKHQHYHRIRAKHRSQLKQWCTTLQAPLVQVSTETDLQSLTKQLQAVLL